MHCDSARWRAAALLALVLGVGDANAEDAGLAPIDAGVGGSDAGPSPLPPSQQRLRRLELALAGSDQLDVALATLFVVDILDEDAVGDRIERLGERARELRVHVTSTATIADADVFTAQLQVIELERRFLAQPPELRAARLSADEARQALRRELEQAAEAHAGAVVAGERAEAARARALEEAAAASTTTVRTLKSERAAVARARSELADLDRARSLEIDARARAHATALAEAEGLVRREQRSVTSSVAQDARNWTRAALAAASADLGDAITALRSQLAIPRPNVSMDSLPAKSTPEERAARAELGAALAAFDTAATEVLARDQRARLAALESTYQRVMLLADTKERLFDRLSPEVRSTLLGLSSVALEEMRVEADVLRLGSAARARLALEHIEHLDQLFADRAFITAAVWIMAKVALVLIVALWLRRRVPDLLRALRRYELRAAGSIIRLRRLEQIARALGTFGNPLTTVVSAHLIIMALGPVAGIPEIDALLGVLLWLAYFRLFGRTLEVVIFWFARRGRRRLERATRLAIERSVLTVARLVFAGGIFLTLVEALVGRGALYGRGRQLVIALGVVVALALLRRWRRAIAKAYLAQFPEGRLADLVKSSQDRFYSFAVVGMAFAVVTVSWIAGLGRDALLSFDESRKALAFVFRKRLERKAEKLPRAEFDRSALPEALVDAFTESPLIDGSLRVDRFDGLEEFVRELERWQEGEAKGSFLLHAPAGYGKTTWLMRAAEEVSGDGVVHVPVDRHTDGWSSLLTALGGEGEGDPSTRIERRLLAGPRCVVMVDDLHNLFFRAMGGMSVLDGLMRLIERTAHHVFWVCAVDGLAWRYIRASRPRRSRFRVERGLAPWSEAEIRQLLMARAVASGIVHHFGDLTGGDAMDASQLVDAGESYVRLIWDASDGCPRVALHYWLRSLVPMGDAAVRVRLFAAVEASELEQMPEESVFLYAALAQHENLSAAEVGRVLRYPLGLCEAILVQGAERGWVRRITARRYRFTSRWYRPVMRFLKRQHVI